MTSWDQYFFSPTTRLSEAVTCHSFHCFWIHCPQWIVAWYSVATIDFFIGFWAFCELIHIFKSIRRIKKTSGHQLFIRNHSKLCTPNTSSNPHRDQDVYGNLNQINQSFGYNQHHQSNQSSAPSIFSNVSTLKPLFPSPSSMRTKSRSHRMQSSPSVSHPQTRGVKVQMFETRKSQKLFLIFITISMWCRSYIWIRSPFSLTQCSMKKVDTPTLFYAILNDVAPNLFCYAFSCLAYELSKLYFSLTMPREHESAQRRRRIRISLILVVSVSILITLRTAMLFSVLVVDMERDHDLDGDDEDGNDRMDRIKGIIESVDFYCYGVCCLWLGLYFLRFAFPIYRLYYEIVQRIHNRNGGRSVIRHSMSSDHDKFSRTDVSHTDDWNHAVSHGSRDIHEHDVKRGKRSRMKGLEEDTLSVKSNYFVSSMKRTWLMALYCGVAFILRAIVLLFFAKYFESSPYILSTYYAFFEAAPNLMMLYIYHRSTKNMNLRYQR